MNWRCRYAAKPLGRAVGRRCCCSEAVEGRCVMGDEVDESSRSTDGIHVGDEMDLGGKEGREIPERC